MTHLIIRTLVAAMVVVGCMGAASQVSAVSLTTSSPQFLGQITPSIPSSPANEASYITTLAGLAPGTTNFLFSGQDLDRSGFTACFPTCPAATAVGSVKVETGANTGNFGGGYTYLIGKYDADKAGALVWYVAGLTGDFDIPASLNDLGLSHWTLYNPGGVVPEPGTFVLLGSALVGLGFWARARRKR